jgi:kinetochore protein Spc7/SPC105
MTPSMFNKDTKDQATKDARSRPKRMSFLEQPSKQTPQIAITSSSHRQSLPNRRQSLPTTSVTSQPKVQMYVPEGEAQGEMSMDLDTESEHDSEEEYGEQSGIIGPGDISGAAPGFGLDEVDEDDEEEVDGDGEMDMDETSVYGGIIRRNSVAPPPTNPDESYTTDPDMDLSLASTTGTDGEKTMDFTVAIGGVLPRSPPVGAANNRNSIGYSLPASPNSHGNRFHPGDHLEGDADMNGEMDMEETIAIGGFVNGDDTLSSMGSEVGEVVRERTMTFNFGDIRASANTDTAANAEGDDSMAREMTMAMGGILQTAYPPISPNRSSAPTLTRPTTGTPSFARPTLSSSQRSLSQSQTRTGNSPIKRNVFAPSPSPFKSTPRKSNGMEVAGEVAKRLSFGSTTTSPGNGGIGIGSGKKRPRENGSTSPAKRRSIHIPSQTPDGVFNPPTPIRAQTQAMIMRSPGKSPALRRMLGEQDVEREEEGEGEGWGSPQKISLGAFLEMAGVEFMEGLPGGGVRRRSSVGRGLTRGQGYVGGECFVGDFLGMGLMDGWD